MANVPGKKPSPPPADDFGFADDLGFGSVGGGDLGFNDDLGLDPDTQPDGVALIENPDYLEDVPEGGGGTFEEESGAEISETLRRMRDIQKNAQERFKTHTDTDYFICVVFLSQPQKDAFLANSGWGKYSGGGGRYLNGLALARDLGIEIPEEEFKPFEPKK